MTCRPRRYVLISPNHEPQRRGRPHPQTPTSPPPTPPPRSLSPQPQQPPPRRRGRPRAAGNQTAGMHDALISRYREVNVQTHDCGPMEVACEHCGARHARMEESTGIYKFANCKGGTVKPDAIPPLPLTLRRLLTDDTEEARHFRLHIRSYNSDLLEAYRMKHNRTNFKTAHGNTARKDQGHDQEVEYVDVVKEEEPIAFSIYRTNLLLNKRAFQKLCNRLRSQ